MQDDILVYGGSGGREKQPEFVTGEWSIASEFLKQKSGSVSLAMIQIATYCASHNVRLLDLLTIFTKFTP